MRILDIIIEIPSDINLVDSSDYLRIKDYIFMKSRYNDLKFYHTFILIDTFVKIKFNEEEIIIVKNLEYPIKIPIQDIEQDESYLVLKYGRILLEEVR